MLLATRQYSRFGHREGMGGDGGSPVRGSLVSSLLFVLFCLEINQDQTMHVEGHLMYGSQLHKLRIPPYIKGDLCTFRSSVVT